MFFISEDGGAKCTVDGPEMLCYNSSLQPKLETSNAMAMDNFDLRFLNPKSTVLLKL